MHLQRPLRLESPLEWCSNSSGTVEQIRSLLLDFLTHYCYSTWCVAKLAAQGCVRTGRRHFLCASRFSQQNGAECAAQCCKLPAGPQSVTTTGIPAAASSWHPWKARNFAAAAGRNTIAPAVVGHVTAQYAGGCPHAVAPTHREPLLLCL